MTDRPVFTGAATALATPFCEDGIDYRAFGKMLDFQLANGINAVVVCGTTGEASTLTPDERKALVSFAAERCEKRIPVIAGAGSNDTRVACALARDAEKSGADALLCVTPYYNKCTQKGLFEHYRAITETVSIPVIVYNVPSRTGMRIEPETAAMIARLPNAAGIKDCGESIADTARIAALCGEGLPIYCGNDDRILPVLSLGGKGAISVVSNVVPRTVAELCGKFFSGDVTAAAKIQTGLMPLVEALFGEVNPIPVKALLSGMGFCKNILRAPLTAMEEPEALKLSEAFRLGTANL